MYVEYHTLDNLISNGRSLVLFYADWCPYCSVFMPIFESYKLDGYNMIKVKINEDDNPLWDRFNIMTIPTLIAFKDGKMIARRDAKAGVGLSKDDIESLIKELK